ncbi:MAG: hypothetical protein J6W64_02955, partial [Bacilli bacterium]|nr:hypothetical protein [Bacilli bacterium]
HENIVFYAKMTESNNVPVNVTYNLNGGTWKKAQLEELFTPAATVNIDYYRTYDDQYGYHVTLSPAQAGEWWYYILLEKTQYEGVYCINQIVYRKSSITEYYDLLITWHNACQDEMAKTVLTSIYNDRATYAGYYVTLSGIPSDNATTITTASIVAKFYSNINSDCNTSYTLRTALPIPARLGYTFEGWKSSIDGINYTTFPGYESSPGDIAYTAQWTEADPLTISALRTQFLNDLNTASGLSTTADTFYATYAEKLIVNSSGEKAGYLIDNVELREKYMWLFEYAINHGINESAVGNEYLAYAASVLGIEYFGTTDAATSDLNYADRAFTNTLYNILNDTAIKDETLTGNASALANPNVETPYIGLIFNSSE